LTVVDGTLLKAYIVSRNLRGCAGVFAGFMLTRSKFLNNFVLSAISHENPNTPFLRIGQSAYETFTYIGMPHTHSRNLFLSTQNSNAGKNLGPGPGPGPAPVSSLDEF